MPAMPQQKIRQYGIWLLLIGPALFFVTYYFAQNSASAPKIQATLPQNIYPAGEPARIDQYSVSVLPSYRWLKELRLPGNTVVADAGWTFLIVPVSLPEQLQRTGSWQAVDVRLNPYPLLKTLAFWPESPGATAPGPADLQYQVYKIPENTARSKLYILWKLKNQQFCWSLE
ncbi:MAG: hypothetical protein ACUVTU_05125 [Desulfurispora sp.]|uniref:hypothetical protein n=1 Tax=Desulfurispora sp. TaxID=3014275 RepID=UPI00404932F6